MHLRTDLVPPAAQAKIGVADTTLAPGRLPPFYLSPEKKGVRNRTGPRLGDSTKGYIRAFACRSSGWFSATSASTTPAAASIDQLSRRGAAPRRAVPGR